MIVSDSAIVSCFILLEKHTLPQCAITYDAVFRKVSRKLQVSALENPRYLKLPSLDDFSNKGTKFRRTRIESLRWTTTMPNAPCSRKALNSSASAYFVFRLRRWRPPI